MICPLKKKRTVQRRHRNPNIAMKFMSVYVTQLLTSTVFRRYSIQYSKKKRHVQSDQACKMHGSTLGFHG